jgi:hypothetical protein
MAKDRFHDPVAEQEQRNWEACATAALKDDHTIQEAESCDDGARDRGEG